MSRTRVTEEEARRLWERAAQLQEQARRQLEGQVDGPPADTSVPGEFDLEHVRQAAVEAGIDASFVDSAWTESQVGVRPARPALDRRITAFLGRDDGSLEVSRIIEAPPADVLEAVLEVATSDRCRLQPLDWVGGHPLEGGALVFKPSPTNYTTGMGTTGIGKAAMWADIKEFVFRFRDLGDGRTEVRVRSSLEHSRKLGFWVGLPVVGIASAGAGLAVAGLVSLLGVAVPVLAGAGAAGVAAGWWGSIKGYRAAYGYGLSVGRTGIDELLQQIAVHLRTRLRRTPLPGSDGKTLSPGG